MQNPLSNEHWDRSLSRNLEVSPVARADRGHDEAQGDGFVGDTVEVILLSVDKKRENFKSTLNVLYFSW